MTAIPVKIQKYFSFKSGLSPNEVAPIFKQLESFLKSTANRRSVPSQQIDDAWHAFILHTKEYEAYCLQVIGKYVHHVPDDLDSTVGSNDCEKGCSSSCEKE